VVPCWTVPVMYFINIVVVPYRAAFQTKTG